MTAKGHRGITKMNYYLTEEEKRVIELLRATANEAQLKRDTRIITILTNGTVWNFGISVQKPIHRLREINKNNPQ